VIAVDARPRRIQRSRKKGSRLPPNTVCVTRPGKWGNPFEVVRTEAGEWEVHDGTGTVVYGPFASKEAATQHAVIRFKRDLVSGALDFTVADVRRELAGKTLACWCAEGAPWCHGDVLLSVAGARRAGADRAVTA
jgi:hypothetical protein